MAHNLKLNHELTAPSLDIIRLLKYQPQPASEQVVIPHAAHTDMGSLTFLFTRQLGLQIQCPGDGNEAEDWRWVQPPRAGHAIVNLGDSLSLLTNGVLRSSDSGGRARVASADVQGVGGEEVFGIEIGGKAAGFRVDDDWATEEN
ncbi:hypothetical protein ATERTT37_000011 [Aspergillus terreus]